MTTAEVPEKPVKRRKLSAPVRVWQAAFMAFVTVLVAFGVTIGYIGQVSYSRRVDTCRVIKTQLTVYTETPPSTPTGIKARDAWAKLNTSLACDKVKVE